MNVNINFTNDVCYKGLFHLNESIKTGKPEGLKELDNWDTVYEGLSQLTPEIQKSWFEFDHHYSDAVFNDALKIVFRSNPKTIFDIGGNTGKFAISCCNYNDDVSIKVVDLPGQLNKTLANAKNEGFEKRVSGHEIDCFSEEEIIKILTTSVKSMDDTTELLIMEMFTDRQKFDNAKFVLEATSLYFTILVNGNSKIYQAEVFLKLIDKAGLVLTKDITIGEYHTILVCKKK